MLTIPQNVRQSWRALESVASRYAPSRTLSFNTVHVFMAMQRMHDDGRSSRRTLCHDLSLGEGAVKTVVKHMKMHGLVSTSNGGMKMTSKGRGVFSDISVHIPAGLSLPRCSIALGRYNYGVILKQLAYVVRSGIEQRDAAIKMGATGATTLIFNDNKFVMPASSHDSLRKEKKIRTILMQRLSPSDGDVIIIGSADSNEKTAELAAKNAALHTIRGLVNL